MKKTLKGYLLGFLTAVILTSTITYAANTTTLYDVMTSGIRIVIDGKELHPTDANGEKVEPFIYNGTTYLPVRSVATALGKAVYWDGPEYAVYLGDMDGKLEYPTAKMEDLTNISGYSLYKAKSNYLTDNYGNKYNSAMIFEKSYQ